jgi:hypothetical protein
MGNAQNAPTGYQPPNQAGAAAGFQQGTSQLQTAGANLSNQVTPALAGAASNVANNPYAAGAQAGAGQVAQLGQGVAGQQFGGAGQDTSLAALAQSYIPATTLPGLQAGYQTLQTAFDPQQNLYGQLQQANADQSNAINASMGVSGSPYGASLTGISNNNFNTAWQNNLLNRQMQGISAFDAATQSAAGNLSNLAGTATGSNQAASTLGTAGLGTISQSSAAPSEAYLQQQQATLQALLQQIQGTTGANQLTQQGVQDQGQYLGIGQSATQLAQSSAQINNQASQAAWGGIGSLLGDVMSLFSPVGEKASGTGL